MHDNRRPESHRTAVGDESSVSDDYRTNVGRHSRILSDQLVVYIIFQEDNAVIFVHQLTRAQVQQRAGGCSARGREEESTIC